MSEQCNLQLIFSVKKFDLLDLELYTNDQKILFNSAIQDSKIIIAAKIHLPTMLKIVSQGKNLTLEEFWLGNIKASNNMLKQNCSVTYLNKTVSSNCLLIPGTMTIEIYSRTFIEYHLMNKNFCHYEY